MLIFVDILGIILFAGCSILATVQAISVIKEKCDKVVIWFCLLIVFISVSLTGIMIVALTEDIMRLI